MSIEQQLTALAESLRIELLGDPKPEALEPVRAGIGPELPNLEFTEILEGNVNLTATIQPLTAVTKDVHFSDPYPEVPVDQKSFDKLNDPKNVLPTSSLTSSSTIVPGIIAQLSGLVASLTGKIPIPSTTSLPVTIEARWFVSDEKDGTSELQEGKDFFAPEGLLARAASFLFLPQFSEQIPTPEPVSSRWLFAKVKLLAGGVSTPEVALPGVEIKMPSILLAPLLAERFNIRVPETTLPPAAPALPELFETQVPNVFTRVQELVPGVNVSFSYTLKKNDQDPAENDVVAGPGSTFPRSDSWPLGSLKKFYMRPGFEALKETTSQDEWTIEVKVSVSGLPGNKSAEVSLPPVKLFQLPVLLPVLVAGFDERWWDGDEAIVFVNHNTPLFHEYVDRNNTTGVEQVKAALRTYLDSAVSVLRTLQPLFHDLLPNAEDQLDHLESFVRIFRTRAASNLVLTAEEQRDDLGNYNPGWYDRISSLFMIGVHDGRTRFKLFEGKAQKSHELHLLMPAGYVAASYWTIHESAFDERYRDSFSSPPTIPDPGVLQDGRSDNYPDFPGAGKSFGNIAKSFGWDAKESGG